jgi:hypothetical protein
MRNWIAAGLLASALAFPAFADPTEQSSVTAKGGTIPNMGLMVPGPNTDISGNPIYVPPSASNPLPISNGGGVAPYTYTPLGCQVLPSLASATGFTSVPAGATLADIQVTTQNVNYRDDGTNPTASTGLTIFAGQPFLPYSGNLAAIKFIQQTATAAGYACFYK